MLWISSEISLVDCADFSASSGCFDRRVQGKQVGLFRQVVDDLDDFANVIGALPERVDDGSR